MSYIWAPDEGEIVAYRDEGEGFSETVTVTVDPVALETDPTLSDPDGFEVSGLQDPIQFATLNNTWTVSATKEEAAGIFPIEITYLLTKDESSMNVVTEWEELPTEAHDIIKLETMVSSPFINTFTVTALSNGSPVDTKTYSVKIIHVYTANADRLVLEVDERR